MFPDPSLCPFRSILSPLPPCPVPQEAAPCTHLKGLPTLGLPVSGFQPTEKPRQEPRGQEVGGGIYFPVSSLGSLHGLTDPATESLRSLSGGLSTHLCPLSVGGTVTTSCHFGSRLVTTPALTVSASWLTLWLCYIHSFADGPFVHKYFSNYPNCSLLRPCLLHVPVVRTIPSGAGVAPRSPAAPSNLALFILGCC